MMGAQKTPEWQKKLAVLEAQKLQATRTVGWAMTVPGAVMTVVGALLLLDLNEAGIGARVSGRVELCLFVIAVPLLVGGLRRVLWPRDYSSEGQRDLDREF